MTRPMTGRSLFLTLKLAGVKLAANGDKLRWDGPAKAVTPEVLAAMKALKPELMELAQGCYLGAAYRLIESIADPERQAGMVFLFEERAGVAEYCGNMSRPDAERAAYIELARAVEGGGL